MKKHKTKIIFSVLIIAILAFSFWYGGNAPGLRGWQVSQKSSEPASQSEIAVSTPSSSEEEKEAPIATMAPTETITENTPVPQEETENKTSPTKTVMVIDETTGKDRYLTNPVPEGKPIPVEPQDVSVTEQMLHCTLSVRCDTILENMDWLEPEKVHLVPKDGVIYDEREVVFYEGESVFDVLLREMKQNGIHMEFEHTPLYNSAYIEGIGNLYEFDCGDLSGWMYRVNDWFPNYGCSRYQLKNGDRIEWIYTCKLGADIGGSNAVTGR